MKEVSLVKFNSLIWVGGGYSLGKKRYRKVFHYSIASYNYGYIGYNLSSNDVVESLYSARLYRALSVTSDSDIIAVFCMCPHHPLYTQVAMDTCYSL